jgi:glycosyltransferase involved in cell wall biosynthesis
LKDHPKVVVLTNQTSPYQVEFMDAITRGSEIDLQVIYLYSQRPGRSWAEPNINHPRIILNANDERLPEAQVWVAEADLVVFGYYRDGFAQGLIRLRARTGKPWCFWGERMGVTRLGWAGRVYRLWKLRWLHYARAGIWGIGQFALERYRREFGKGRAYCNVPYFSDLSRFRLGHLKEFSPAQRTILFSGSFIHRKGIDLLASAFLKASRDYPNLRLVLLGDGPLRPDLESELAGCAGRVSFVGFKDWAELPSFYHQADLLCVPSRHDGWGLVVPEGLAAGLPVITTRRVGAGLELIEPERNGWLVEAGDVQELANALAGAARLSQGQLEALSAAALASAENHSLEHGVNRFKEAVSTTLESWN